MSEPGSIELRRKTIDEMISTIMEISQELVGDDYDPGDLTIRVQDDMPLVTVSQTTHDRLFLHTGGIELWSHGSTVDEAVLAYLIRLTNEREIRRLARGNEDQV